MEGGVEIDFPLCSNGERIGSYQGRNYARSHLFEVCETYWKCRAIRVCPLALL